MKPLTFQQVQFLKSCAHWKNCPLIKDDRGKILIEIAVAGRSNVGKSSLLNDLFKTKGLVKTSSQPGKTRLLNFFLVDERVIFCDLPGYGYAKVPQTMRSLWKEMIEPYIEKREKLDLILLLLDIRRDLSEEDLQFFQWVEYHQKKVIIVFTKVDKLGTQVRKNQIQKILTDLNHPELAYLSYSTTKNIGRKELLFEINQVLTQWD